MQPAGRTDTITDGHVHNMPTRGILPEPLRRICGGRLSSGMHADARKSRPSSWLCHPAWPALLPKPASTCLLAPPHLQPRPALQSLPDSPPSATLPAQTDLLPFPVFPLYRCAPAGPLACTLLLPLMTARPCSGIPDSTASAPVWADCARSSARSLSEAACATDA